MPRNLRVGVVGDESDYARAMRASSEEARKFGRTVAEVSESNIKKNIQQEQKLESLARQYRQTAAAAERGSREQVAAARLAEQAEARLERQYRETGTAAARAGKQAEAHAAGMSKSIKAAIGLGAAYVGVHGLVSLVEDSVTKFNEQQLALDRVGQTFGSNAKQVQHWAETVGISLGLVDDQSETAAANMGVMLRTAGMGEQELAPTVIALTKMAGELALIRNQDPEGVMKKMIAATSGRALGLKQLGILIDNNMIKEEAYRLGIAKSGEALTAQQKALAAVSVILKSQGDVQQQYNAIQDSTAVRVKRFNAQVDQLKEAIGGALEPVVRHYLGVVTDWLGKTENQEKITHAAKDAVKALEKAVATAWPVVKTMVEWANKAADAVGGWENALKLLLALKVASIVSGWAGPIAALIGSSSRGTGLLGAGAAAGGLKTKLGDLAKLGAIGISIPIWLQFGVKFPEASVGSLVGWLVKHGMPQFIPVTIIAKGVQGIFSGNDTMTPAEAKEQFIKEAMANGMTRQEAEDAYRERTGGNRPTTQPIRPPGASIKRGYGGAGSITGPRWQTPRTQSSTPHDPSESFLGGTPAGGTEHDWTMSAGTTILAPEDGMCVAHGGHDPAEGEVKSGIGGWSLLFYGDSGTTYAGTHLAKIYDGRKKYGDPIAVIAHIGAGPGGSGISEHLHWETKPGGTHTPPKPDSKGGRTGGGSRPPKPKPPPDIIASVAKSVASSAGDVFSAAAEAANWAADIGKGWTDAINAARDRARPAVDKFMDMVSRVWDARTQELLDKARATVTVLGETFDIGVGEETPAEKELRTRREARAEADRQDAIAQARKRLAEAQTDEERKQAQKDLNDAIEAEYEASLEKRAEAERKAADKALSEEQREIEAKRAIDEIEFQKRLQRIENEYEAGKISRAQAQREINELLGKYGVSAQDAKRLLGETFGTELKKALDGVLEALTGILNQIRKMQGLPPIKIKVDVETSVNGAPSSPGTWNPVTGPVPGSGGSGSRGIGESFINPPSGEQPPRGPERGSFPSLPSEGGASGAAGPEAPSMADLLNDSDYAAALRQRHGKWLSPRRWPRDLLPTATVWKNVLEKRLGDRIHFESAWPQALYALSLKTGNILGVAGQSPPQSISDLTSGEVWYDFPGGAWKLPPEIVEAAATAVAAGMGPLGSGTGSLPPETGYLERHYNLAGGGVIRARSGGTLLRLAEAGRDEQITVTPLGQNGTAGGLGDTHIHLHLDGPVFGDARRVADELAEEMESAMRRRVLRGQGKPIT